MAEPTKIPDNADPDNVTGKRAIDRNSGAVPGRGRPAPWVWIVGIIVVLLIIWAVIGISHQRQVGDQTTVPAPVPAASIR